MQQITFSRKNTFTVQIQQDTLCSAAAHFLASSPGERCCSFPTKRRLRSEPGAGQMKQRMRNPPMGSPYGTGSTAVSETLCSAPRKHLLFSLLSPQPPQQPARLLPQLSPRMGSPGRPEVSVPAGAAGQGSSAPSRTYPRE